MQIHDSAMERLQKLFSLTVNHANTCFCYGKTSKTTADKIDDFTKVRVTSNCNQFCKKIIFPKNVTYVVLPCNTREGDSKVTPREKEEKFKD